jgi:hypothetical protein
MKKKIDLAGSLWYKNRRPILPFKFRTQWYWFKTIKTTYLVMHDGQSCPIKTEIL